MPKQIPLAALKHLVEYPDSVEYIIIPNYHCKYYSINTIANLLNVTVQTIYIKIKQFNIKCIKSSSSNKLLLSLDQLKEMHQVII